MSILPAPRIDLFDSRLRLIGCIRLVVSSEEKRKGECIFDMRPLTEDARPETRWLCKRRFQKVGEHRFKMHEEGGLTIHGGDFKVRLEAQEPGHDLVAQPPAPKVFGRWTTS